MVLQNGSLFLLPGSGRYSVAASIPGEPSYTARGDFSQTESGSVLTARTAEQHVMAVEQFNTLIRRFLLDDAIGLEVVDSEGISVVAFLGVELHQLLLVAQELSLEIDESICNRCWETLIELNEQLEHLREIHKRGHQHTQPYLPHYFAFVAEHPLPGDRSS